MNKSIRYPVLQHCLKFIKEVSPESFRGIVDVGVQHGTEFLMDVFPDSHHYLFEPVMAYHSGIHHAYGKRDIAYTFYGIGLTDVSSKLFLHQLSSDGSGKITHSELSEEKQANKAHLHSIEEIEGRRLDEVMFEPALERLQYLVKMDVDGIEEKIISGGEKVIRGASFVVLEASVVRDNLLARLQLMKDLGFRLFDICDNAYYYNQLSCMDLVFINSSLRQQEIKFRPWELAKFQVHWDKWQHGYPELGKLPVPKVFS